MTDEQNVRPMWSEEQLDQALATLNSQVPPGDKALAEARATLMSAAGAPTPVRKRHWGRWAAAVATVAAVAAAVLVVPTIQIGDQPAPATAAAAMLNQAADRISTSDPVVKPGQYRYVETHAWHSVSLSLVDNDPKPLIYLQESVTQTWIPTDRTQEWLQRSAATGNRKWITGSDAELRALGSDHDRQWTEELRAKCGDFHLDRGQRECSFKGDWENPKPDFVMGLPTDPRELYDAIRDELGEGRDDDGEVMNFVASVVRTGLPTAATRANLYRALALLPSLEISDSNANLDGRIGVGLGLTHNGRKKELIIDPATGQLIGERETTIAGYGTVPAGTVEGYTSVSTGVVDKVGDKPVS